MPDYGFGRCDDHHKIADFYSSTVHRTVILRETSPDFLGNPAGRLRGSRNRLSEAVICALLRDFSKHGEKAIAKVRRTQPAAYLKICALLAPKEMKLEHTNPLARTNSNAEPGKSLGRRSRPSRSTLMVGRPRRNRYDDQRQRKNHREAKSTPICNDWDDLSYRRANRLTTPGTSWRRACIPHRSERRSDRPSIPNGPAMSA
jgi:hypothetical protein